MIRDTLLKKLAISLIFVFAVLFIPRPSSAADSTEVCPVDDPLQCTETTTVTGNDSGHTQDCEKVVYFFYGEECPHCQEEEKLLDDLMAKHPEIVVKRFEVWHSKENQDFFKSFAKSKGFEPQAVPTTVIGHQVFKGYASYELSGVEIERSIYDLFGITDTVAEKSINIPFYGKVEVAKVSLPVITLLLGLLDGFNPCAMWALVALITILIATGDKKKIRLVGSIFLISSWLIYYIFMAVYLNAFILLSAISIIRMLIGLVAIFAGGWYLKEYFTYQPGVCKVTNSKQQSSLVERMKKVAEQNSLWLIIIGVIALAFSVNLVEMMCSIGLPAVYAQILATNDVSSITRYIYLAVYNTLYMADDIVVFIIAAITMNYVNLNHKYDRAMKLIGGALIIVLGLILIFKPGLLSF
jgi:cytochrome c biogenesis protein CcdA/thiol-disulfide isomerase/thioredoxin